MGLRKRHLPGCVLALKRNPVRSGLGRMPWFTVRYRSARSESRLQQTHSLTNSHMTHFQRIGAAAMVLLASTHASAHPGHGHTETTTAGQTLVHYFTEPVHLAGLAAALAIASVAAALITRSLRRAA